MPTRHPPAEGEAITRLRGWKPDLRPRTLTIKERDVSMEITVSAPNVEAAIEEGLARLGLSREQVEIEVVDKGSKGILGIGARNAKVRLRPIVEEEPEPEEVAEEPPPETAEEYTLTEEQVAEIARQTLVELLGKMGVECQVAIRQEVADEAGPLTLDVLGEGLDFLIGPQKEVLNALQFITRLIVSREIERWVNLVVDVERYRQRRAQSLTRLARRMAERVARTKQPISLEPMPPDERRVIHVALRDHPTVTTQSVGKGKSRKVTIIPRR